ncbi:CoA transferase [soil metagenome]
MDPLNGMRVLDFGSFITAPYAAMLLAEYGADVVKIERPGRGDPFRVFGAGLYSPQFQAHNKHKRSLVLDYKSEAGRRVLAKLVSGADVVIVNSRPGVAATVGLDYDTLRAINDRIVYCAITGFGETGPYAMRPAFDNVGQALSGWMSRFRTDDDSRVVGPAVSDAATGMHAAMGIMAALLRRVETGKGARVDVNMIESTIALGIEPLTQYLSTGTPVPVFQRAAMSQAYSVTCSDGRRIGLHLSSPPKFWQSLCKAIDRPQWINEYPERMDRVRGYETLAALMNEAFSARPCHEWTSILAEQDVPFAPELDLEDLQADPQISHLGVFHDVEHPRYGTLRSAHRPVRIDGSHEEDPRAPPDLGEHTREVLLEAGFTASQVDELESAGVLGSEKVEA